MHRSFVMTEESIEKVIDIEKVLRSKMGNKLLEFKGGSFKAAQKAKCPIVPCALINSFVPFDENSVRQVTVKLLYLKPLYYEEYRHMRSNEIAEEVKRRIEEAIEKNL